MHYLRHLARLGTPDVHPAGECATWQLIEAMELSGNLRLLELGCGTGNTVCRLARRGDVYVVGLDLLNEMIEASHGRLRRLSANCAIVRADARSLPFRDRTFDRAYAESSLGMQSNSGIKSFLAEAFRVLKPGGLFVANEAIWKPQVDQTTVTTVNRLSERDFGLRPASEDAWTTEHWLGEIRGAGFRDVAWSELTARNCRPRPGAFIVKCLQRLRIMSSPARRADRAYRRLIDRHRAIGALLEARLFVARKP